MGKEHVGFIGVGLMGHGMAKNILQKGEANIRLQVGVIGAVRPTPPSAL
jgi:3-hydroxyisobutyrate dehydrogenase-like beta-hydroxyacid dehydrogenase